MWHAWGRVRGVYRILVVRPKGNRPLRRRRHMYLHNIKLGLKEIGIDVPN